MNRSFLLLTILILAGCRAQQMPAETVEKAVPSESQSGSSNLTQTAELMDVTEGVTIGGIVNTKGFATGTAILESGLESSKLTAEFGMLPELSKEYFYEGWLVRNEPLSFISTGETEAGDTSGEWLNNFTSTDDLSMYDMYVVTLEPKDSDPAPGEHLLEGEFY